MTFTETAVAGVWIVSQAPRGDDRGFFARMWCEEEFAARGLVSRFPQANNAYSRFAGTLRGLHYQAAPHGEVKLVRCIRGVIFDVVADVRPDSPTRGRWLGVELSAENRQMLYVPEGCAHGYLTLTDDSEVIYPVSSPYAPPSERGVRWDDPAFAIDWPLTPVHVSPKDHAWPDVVLHALDGPA